MKKYRPLLITCSLVLGYPFLAAGQTDPAAHEKVQALIAEIKQKVGEASASLQGFHQISASESGNTPVARVYRASKPISGATAEDRKKAVEKEIADSLEEAKSSSVLAKNSGVSQRIEFYRGPGASYRAEFSPRIRSQEVNGVVNEAQTALGMIAFHGEDGKTFVRDFNLGLAKNGDVMEMKDLRENTTTPNRSQEISRGYHFGPDYIFTIRGIPWDGYFEKGLSAMDSATRTEIPDGALTYQFFMHGPPDKNVTTILEFGNHRGERRPARYECRQGDEIVESQVWEYTQQDGHTVPAKSTYKYQSPLPDVETTLVMTYEFSNDRPELGADDLKADHPLSEKMQALFAKGKELAIKKAADESGIQVSGKTVNFPAGAGGE